LIVSGSSCRERALLRACIFLSISFKQYRLSALPVPCRCFDLVVWLTVPTNLWCFAGWLPSLVLYSMPLPFSVVLWHSCSSPPLQMWFLSAVATACILDLLGPVPCILAFIYLFIELNYRNWLLPASLLAAAIYSGGGCHGVIYPDSGVEWCRIWTQQ
jgi:hypothetical protein